MMVVRGPFSLLARCVAGVARSATEEHRAGNSLDLIDCFWFPVSRLVLQLRPFAVAAALVVTAAAAAVVAFVVAVVAAVAVAIALAVAVGVAAAVAEALALAVA